MRPKCEGCGLLCGDRFYNSDLDRKLCETCMTLIVLRLHPKLKEWESE